MKLRALAAVAALTMLAACGSGGRSTGAGSQTPVRGGTLKLSMTTDPGCLDGHAVSSEALQVLGRVLYDNLVAQEKDGTIKPWLATSWSISADRRTYTFHLKHGVTFSDGAPFNAKAVQVNLEHMLDPATKSPLAASYIAPYKSSTIIDNYTIAVHLRAPYSPFLDVLAQSWLGMDSPKAIEKDPQSLCQHPVGSGPFVLKSYDLNQKAVFTRRAGYDWPPSTSGHTGAPYLNGIEVDFVAEDQVRFNSLMSGQYDATAYVPPQDAATVQKNSQFNYVSVDRSGSPSTLTFNVARAPFNDIKVRKAFAQALNLPAIVKSVGFGHYDATTDFVGKNTQYYDASAGLKLGYDPGAANKLLDQAGWTGRDSTGYRTKNGKRLKVVLPQTQTSNPTALTDQVQAAVKKVGIDLSVDDVPTAAYSERRYAGDYDLISGVWHTNTPDVLYIKYATASITTKKRLGQNASNISDPQLDTLLEQARETTDGTRLAALYSKAQQRVTQLVPALPLYENPSQFAYHTYVHNVVTDPVHGVPVFTYSWITK